MHLSRFVAEFLLLPAIYCFSFLHPPVRLERRPMKIVPRQAYFGKRWGAPLALSFMPWTLDTGVYKDRAPAPIGRLVMPVKFQPSTLIIFTTTTTTQSFPFLSLSGLVSRYMSDSVSWSSAKLLLVSAVHVCRQPEHIAVD